MSSHFHVGCRVTMHKEDTIFPFPEHMLNHFSLARVAIVGFEKSRFFLCLFGFKEIVSFCRMCFIPTPFLSAKMDI